MEEHREQVRLDASHCEEVAALFVRMGADQAQAAVMAKQLLKRSKQLASERGMTELEALESLLKQVIQARAGGETP